MQDILEIGVTLSVIEDLENLATTFDLVNNSKAFSEYCQIKASNDLEAVKIWLNCYQNNEHTYRAYKREAERLLLWCMYYCFKSLNDLDLQDFEQYFIFLSTEKQDLDILEHNAKLSQTFAEPLGQSALAFAKRALNSLLNFLVNANYLRANPLKLLKHNKRLDFSEHKYKVWERMLETDEWDAVQQALLKLPETNTFEIDNKMRTQFLFALLYFLGLRINEVATHTWGSFRQRGEQWWFFVKGKGGKLGHIPVNNSLLAYVKNYRLHLGKSVLPKAEETDPLLRSMTTKKPLKIGQLYNLVKYIGELAADAFPDDLSKQQKLKKLSPHWLRHLSASHQDKAGIPTTIIQANHRHSSIQTTQIYVHAEEDRRFEEMQKMQMDLQSKLLVPNTKFNTLEITMQLSKGPINKVMGLRRVINGLESYILNQVRWTRIAPTQLELADLSEQTLIGQTLELSYHLYSTDAVNNPTLWERAFKRQAELWLFTSKIYAKPIEAANGAS